MKSWSKVIYDLKNSRVIDPSSGLWCQEGGCENSSMILFNWQTIYSDTCVKQKDKQKKKTLRFLGEKFLREIKHSALTFLFHQRQKRKRSFDT